MAQQVQDTIVSLKTKAGVTYYATVDKAGRLSTTKDQKLANVTNLADYAKNGVTPRMIATGGIVVITRRTPEQLKQRRDERRNARKAHDKAVEDRVWKKVEQGKVPKEIMAKLAQKKNKQIESMAKKSAKEKLKKQRDALNAQIKSM